MSVDLVKRQRRVDASNELLRTIASCGRRFFSNPDGTDRLELDRRGRVWFVSMWNHNRIYTHYRYWWRKFPYGGTLKDLIVYLRKFIMSGQQLHPLAFGPWPEWVCAGDLWGYGDDMEKVRRAAFRLGIIRKEPSQ